MKTLRNIAAGELNGRGCLPLTGSVGDVSEFGFFRFAQLLVVGQLVLRAALERHLATTRFQLAPRHLLHALALGRVAARKMKYLMLSHQPVLTS